MYYHPAMLPNTALAEGASRVVSHPQSGEGKLSVSELHQATVNNDFSLSAEHVPAGNEREVCRHLNTVSNHQLDNAIDGVALLPVYEDKIGLARVLRHPLGRLSWEVIKWGVLPGENAGETAARELLRLNGIFVNDHMLVDIGVISTESEGIRGRTRCFVAGLEEKHEKDAGSELGHTDIFFFRQDVVDKLVMESEIDDTTTLGIMFLERLRRTNPTP